MEETTRGCVLSQRGIELLFPMHLLVDRTGNIGMAGPTIRRILGGDLSGTSFFRSFAVEKPRSIVNLENLRARAGIKLNIVARPENGQPIRLRGVAVPCGPEAQELFVDLSFGSSMAEAFNRFQLTAADFKPNDFSIDIFYTLETQRTLLEDSQKLTNELTAAKEEAERIAYSDSVTAIGNRRALRRKLEEMLDCDASARNHALFHIDLDKFKSVNDTFGHAAGDRVLQHTAAVLKAMAGPDDIAARIGGDEFALVLSVAPDEKKLVQIAEELVACISTPIRADGHIYQVGASVGIARFKAGDDISADTLLSHSDIALYAAKEGGGGPTLLQPEMINRQEETRLLVAEIEIGIEELQFVPYFQPQIDTKTGAIHGMEVLARWHSPLGVRTPAQFLETAVRYKLMEKIDQQIRQQAVRIFSGWIRTGYDPGMLSLNTTATNLRSPDFLENLLDEMLVVGLPPCSVQLELLESILFDQTDDFLARQCHSLKASGFQLALDDFGTGHASIATLIEAPITTLKIDRSFVSGIDRNPKLQKITGSMLAMAEHMELEVLAEGVERQEEFEFLTGFGCNLFQGYYFGAPMNEYDTLDWIRTRIARLPEMSGRLEQVRYG